MVQKPDTRPLRDVLGRLRELGAIPATGEALLDGQDTVLDALRESILGQVQAFTASRNPEILPDLEGHSRSHVDEIIRLLRGGAPGEFDFVAAQARRRAEQRFPLEAMLHAYRCGHRVIYGWIRDSAVAGAGVREQQLAGAVADFAIEYTDLISTIVAAEYVRQTRLLSEAETDRRAELLGILLGGYDESDGRVARMLRQAGYLEQRQSYCVAIARSVEPREMEHPPRARRMADAVSDCLAGLTGRLLVGVRDNQVVAIVSDTRRISGWTAAQTELADRVFPALLGRGPAAVVGMSTDVPSTSYIPKAYEEARLALDFAHVADRVVRYSEIPFRQMLVRHARDTVQAALPLWADALRTADASSGGALIATLRAYADADMNVLRTAATLRIHANTVYARLQKIREITGFDARRYHALTDLLLAIDCM